MSLDYLLVRNLLVYIVLQCLITVGNSVYSAVKMKDFTEQVDAESKEKFVEQFELLTTNIPFTQHAAKSLCNEPKNRYKNIVPCKFITVS